MATPGFTKNTPTSENHLHENKFSFSCSYIPDTVYHLQEANIPSISSSPIVHSTPLSPIYLPSDQLEWEPLVISFIIDEELANYRKMHDWLVSITTASDTFDLTLLKREDLLQGDRLGGGVTDATVTIRSNKHNPTARVQFHDLFPTSLSGIEFTTNTDTSSHLVCTAQFAYSTYDIKYIK